MTDRQSIYSFGSLLRQLHARQGQLSAEANVEAAGDFLQKRAEKLKNCANPFGSPNATSRTKVESGSLTSDDGQAIQLKPEERELAKSIAQRLVLDEIQAAILLLAWKRHRAGDELTQTKLETNDDFWTDFTLFTFSERLDIINTVTHLLKIVPQDADIDTKSTATSFLNKLLDPLQTGPIAKSLLDRVVHLAKTPIPQSAGADTPLWAAQHVREQHALLQVYFLLYFNRMYPDGRSLLDILSCISSCEWGTLQVNEGYFDSETRMLANGLPSHLTLVALENLNLERAASPQVEDYTLPSGSSGSAIQADALLQPKIFEQVHKTILELAHESRFPMQSGPLLLGWSYILYRITTSLASMELPESHYDMADVLLPKEQHVIRPGKSQSPANSNQSSQALYEALIAYAIASPSIQAFAGVNALLSTTPIAQPEASSQEDTLGYLSIVQSLLSTAASIIYLPALPSTEYSELVAIFEKLYSQPSATALRAEYWHLYESGDSTLPQGHLAILELARDRFPCDVVPLLRLLRALSSSPSSAFHALSHEGDAQQMIKAELDSWCADNVRDYPKALPTATQLEPPISPVVPLPYDTLSQSDSDAPNLVSLRPIPISASIDIPRGVVGQIVGPEDQKPAVIRWDLERQGGYNGWALLGDILTDFLGEQSGSGAGQSSQADVFKQQNANATPQSMFRWETQQEQIDAVAIVLELINGILSSGSRYSSQLVQDITSQPPEEFISIILRVIETVAYLQPVPTFLLEPAIRVISNLLHQYPGAIWTYLKADSLLLPIQNTKIRANSGPSQVSLLQQDKVKGEYSSTLAILDLVHALFVETQRSILSTSSQSLNDLRRDVLARSVKWVLEAIWPSFLHWRYIDVKQKFELHSKQVAILSLAVEEAEFALALQPAALLPAVELVIDSLLFNSTTSKIAPLTQCIREANSITSYRTAGRHAEGNASEHRLCAVLDITYRLLSLSRILMPGQPSLLERTVLSYSSLEAGSASQSNLIATLFSCFTSSEYSPHTSYLAVLLLARLAKLSSDWGAAADRPSFLGHLGGMKDSMAVFQLTLDIAGDPHVEVELQLGAWSLITNIIESQPGLAELFITGSQAFAPIFGKSAAPEVSETAVTLALKVLEGWEETWNRQPTLLCLALECLGSIWNHYIDYQIYLDKFHQDKTIWPRLCDILCKIVEEPSASEDTDGSQQAIASCNRTAAQAAAARLLGLDIQQAVSSTELSKPIEGHSFQAVVGLLEKPKGFSSAIKTASASTFDPDYHADVAAAFASIFGLSDLSVYKKPLLDGEVINAFGIDYIYPLDLLRKRLEGTSGPDITSDSRTMAIARVESLNLSWSTHEAQSRLSGTWQALLESILPEMDDKRTVASNIWSGALMLAETASTDTRTAELAQAIHANRLSILRSLLEYLTRPSLESKPQDIITLVKFMRQLMTSEGLNPVEALRTAGSTFHIQVFQVCFLAFKLSLVNLKASTAAPAEHRPGLLADTEMCLAVAMTALQAGLLRTSTGLETGNDMLLIVALVQEILSNSIRPRPSFWLAHCQQLDLFRHIFDLLSILPFDDNSQTLSTNLLRLCLTLTAFPQAAETMALSGLVSTINNNTLTEELEAGQVRPRPSEDAALDAAGHEHWCLMLTVMTQLVTQLGHQVPFIENDVLAFVHLYYRQLEAAFLYTPADNLAADVIRDSESVLTLASLQEMRAASLFLDSLVIHSLTVPAVQPVLRKLVNRSLLLLQQLVYLLQHPTSLSKLVEPTTAAERAWLQPEIDSTETINLSNFGKRPVAASIVQEVFSLCYLLVSALVRYTSAFTVLSREDVDWPHDRAIIPVTPSTALGELASQGTLVDLIRSCMDASAAGVSIGNTTLTSTKGLLPAYDASRFGRMATYTIEASMILSGTQLALTAKQQESNLGSDRASQRAKNDLSDLATDFRDEFLDRSGSGASSSKVDAKLSAALKQLLLRCRV